MAGLYFHIPFCASKCHYCNFFSVAGNRDRAEYTEWILREMELRKEYLMGETVHTLYFGGGTPSLLKPSEVDRILQKVRALFSVAADAEITLEANPEHINKDFLVALFQTGVTRLSLGVQSLNDEVLTYLGRRHSAECARQALRCISASPFRNVSADLIFGIPGQTDESLSQDIKVIMDAGVQHVSAYALTIEDRTTLKVNIDRNRCVAPDEEQVVRQFLLMMKALPAAGYEQYELSNYSPPAYRSRHNSAYWQGIPYLGLGASAHSFNGRSRQWNVSRLNDYRQGILNGLPAYETEILTEQQRLNEYLMTALRRIEGVDIEVVAGDYGDNTAASVLDAAQEYIRAGWLLQRGHQLTLTTPGKLMADRVTAGLFQL